MSIKRKDVLRLRIPFPNISSTLAVSSHMYICRNVEESTYEFVKCQTLKPSMLASNIMRHFWDEHPDPARNPFHCTTRIDWDKVFQTSGVYYDDALKTTSRPDVCDDVMAQIETKLLCDGYNTIYMNSQDVLSLNPYTSAME